MPICPLHKAYMYGPDGSDRCPTCEAEGIFALSIEFDKQDRVIDTMRVEGWNFNPQKSRAVVVFERG